MVRSVRMLLAAFIVAGAAHAALDAQRVAPGGRPDTTVPVTIALKVGAEDYSFTGKAACTHAPIAGIYNLRAEQWRVHQSGDTDSLSLTFWHPVSGADMFNLSIRSGNTRAAINTVKVGANGTLDGSGTMTLARSGKGGTFTVSGATAKGAKIAGTIKCDAFTPAFAEGGD